MDNPEGTVATDNPAYNTGLPISVLSRVQRVATAPSKVVGITIWEGKMVVACETGVFIYADGVLLPVAFAAQRSAGGA